MKARKSKRTFDEREIAEQNSNAYVFLRLIAVMATFGGGLLLTLPIFRIVFTYFLGRPGYLDTHSFYMMASDPVWFLIGLVAATFWVKRLELYRIPMAVLGLYSMFITLYSILVLLINTILRYTNGDYAFVTGVLSIFSLFLLPFIGWLAGVHIFAGMGYQVISARNDILAKLRGNLGDKGLDE